MRAVSRMNWVARVGGLRLRLTHVGGQKQVGKVFAPHHRETVFVANPTFGDLDDDDREYCP